MSQDLLISVKHNINIRFNETDALGIVWHGNYLKYFEDGREAFGKHYSISYLDAKKNGYATPIVSTTTEHKLALRYGESAIVETKFINCEAAKMIFQYCITNEAGNIVCTGETTQVFTDLNNENMALTLPEFFKKWKTKHGLLHE